MVTDTSWSLYLRERDTLRRIGRHWGWSGRKRRVSPRPVFDPRTVRTLASRYIEYAVPVHELCDNIKKYMYITVIDVIDSKWALARM